jgi:multicomponent Na+:H+ antiporter subunit C
MTAAIIVGLLAAGGTYLILQRGIVRMALGFVLYGHAATTLLVASGGVGRRVVPFAGAQGPVADPLPQAFALTAIVISFALTAFLLALAFRSRDVLGHDDIEADVEADDIEVADVVTGHAVTGDAVIDDADGSGR